MNFVYAALLLSQTVLGDYAASVSAVNSAAQDLTNKVNGFTGGIFNALPIQNDFPALSSAVAALSNAVQDIPDSEIDVAATQSLQSSIPNLLNALVSKADLLSSAGVSGIVKNDISSLQGPAVGIASGLIHGGGSDKDKVSALTPVLNAISSAFAVADAKFGVATTQWPQPN